MQLRHCSMALAFFFLLIVGCNSTRNQEKQPGSQPSSTTVDTSSSSNAQIPPEAAVITLKGLCDIVPIPAWAPNQKPRPAANTSNPPVALSPNCQTVVTREELERLGKAVSAKPEKLRALATLYVDMLQFSTKGYEMGVVNDPVFQAKAKYSYLQAMAQYGVMAMQNHADDFTDADLEKYYKEHPGRFVQADISQLAVPKHKLHVDKDGKPIPQSSKTQAAEEAEMKKLAAQLRAEAAAGADFDKLEERAYQVALDPSVPDTDLGTRFDDMIPEQYRKLIFDLKEGEVSQVSEDSHEYLIFKIRKKGMLPLAESRHWYGQLIMRDMRKALAASVKVEYNDQYFPATKPPNAGGDEPGVAGTP